MSSVAHVVVHDVTAMSPETLQDLGLQLFQINNRGDGDNDDDFALVQGRVSKHEDKFVFVFVSPMGIAFKPLDEIYQVTKVIELVDPLT